MCGIHTVVTLQKLVESGENPCKLTCVVTWHVRKFVLCSSFAGGKLVVCSTFTKSLPARQEILEPFWRREMRQPHCQIVASKEGDKAFVLGSLGDVLQGLHVLMLCQVLSPRRLAASLVYFLVCKGFRMLKCVGLCISIHVCWSAWVCVSLSTYAEARGFVYLYPRMLKRVGCVFDYDVMMIGMTCVTTGMTTQKKQNV